MASTSVTVESAAAASMGKPIAIVLSVLVVFMDATNTNAKYADRTGATNLLHLEKKNGARVGRRWRECL